MMNRKIMIEQAGLATLTGLILSAEEHLPTAEVRMLVLFASRFGRGHEYVLEAEDAPKPETPKDWVENPRDWTK